jgi:hypothetical protein
MGDTITPGEFERGIRLVTDTVNLGINGVHSRLAVMEERQLDQAREIGEIKSSVPAAAADAARAAVDEHIKARRKALMGWGTAAGTVVAAISEIAHRIFSK